MSAVFRNVLRSGYPAAIVILCGGCSNAMIVPDVTYSKRGNSPVQASECRMGACAALSTGIAPRHVDSRAVRANNRLERVAMNLRSAMFIVLIGLLDCLWSGAQAQMVAPLSGPANSASAEADLEHAFLSTTRYTNAYFGFEFEFPADAGLKPIPLPTTLDRRILLLAMAGSGPPHPVVSISAFEYRGKNWTDAKGILRRELDQELYTGVEELHGLSKTTIDGHQFFYFETRKAVSQHMELTTELNGYVLLVLLQANDPKMLADMTSSFYRAKFFPPQEARQYAGPEAAAYEGPAISSQRLRELKSSPPVERMDPGQVNGNIYRNAQIGFLYEFPDGWSVQPKGAVEPAVERYREKVLDEPGLGPREREVVKTCRRTLLSVWKSKPDADGQVPYEEFGEVTLSAMPLSCFPNIRFPDNPKDADALRRFLMGYSFTQPLQRDMRDARSFETAGKTFVLTSGTIAYKVEGDALSRRISVAIALTQHRGYLLAWLFAAPHDSELRELMNAKVGFDPDPTGKATTTITAGGGETAREGRAEPPATESAAADDPANVNPQPNTGVASTAAPTPAGSGATAAATPAAANPSSGFKPTLLRDGESMQRQQMEGKPVPNKKPN